MAIVDNKESGTEQVAEAPPSSLKDSKDDGVEMSCAKSSNVTDTAADLDCSPAETKPAQQQSSKNDGKDSPAVPPGAKDNRSVSGSQNGNRLYLEPRQFLTGYTSMPLAEYCLKLKAFVDTSKTHSMSRCSAKPGLLTDLAALLEQLSVHVKNLDSCLTLYDVAGCAPGNGYRSLCHMTTRLLNAFVRETGANSPGYFYTKQTIPTRTAKFYRTQLEQLVEMLATVVEMHRSNEAAGDRSLFACHLDEGRFANYFDIDFTCWYGQHFGLHLPTRIRAVMSFVLDTCASLAKGYKSFDSVALQETAGYSGLLRMSLQPELRAKRVVKQLRLFDTTFVKLAWNQTESAFLHKMQNIGAVSVAVNRRIEVKTHTFDVEAKDGSSVVVSPPEGKAQVWLRYISYKTPTDKLYKLNRNTVEMFERPVPLTRRASTFASTPDLSAPLESAPQRSSSFISSQRYNSARPRSSPADQSSYSTPLVEPNMAQADPAKSGSVDDRSKVRPQPLTGEAIENMLPLDDGGYNSSQSLDESDKEPDLKNISSDSLNGDEGFASGQKKEGSAAAGKARSKAPNGFLFHIHGGGFVAQTSRSHAVYLKDWARKLRVPIVSIDYSLSPEAPFGVALDEIYWIYCWLLQNGPALDLPMQTICISGDSAGGNLAFATVMKLQSNNIRLPDALHINYPVTHLRLTPGPSRLLSAGDALLAAGSLRTCVRAYGGVECEWQDHSSMNPLLSPWHASPEMMATFPPTYMCCGSTDPLLDDGVDMARKLKNAGVQVELHVMPCVTHGFLQLYAFCPYAMAAYKQSRTMLCAIYGMSKSAQNRPAKDMAVNRLSKVLRPLSLQNLFFAESSANKPVQGDNDKRS